jgi:SAM-dependent methyltransferase
MMWHRDRERGAARYYHQIDAEGVVQAIDCDSVACLYDVYVVADFDVTFFAAEVRRTSGPVVELTSGTGRLSVPLIETGATLTCVDYSPRMLEVLAGKLATRGLRADVRCADVCDLRLSEQFVLAVLPFQSFMEIVGERRQQAALASVFACLRPGGQFISTMHNPTVRRTHVDETLRVVGRFAFEGGSLVVSGFEQGGRPVVSRLQFFEFFGPDGRLVWKRLLPMEFELVDRERFEPMAVRAGFRVNQLYGNYQRAAFDPGTSPAMIWVLDKPAEPSYGF